MKVEARFGDSQISIESGKVARQADGSAVVTLGDTVVMSAVQASLQPREGLDGVPLSVFYEERLYAAGRIPRNSHRRELGQGTEKEIVTARIIDRPTRPLFLPGWCFDTQVFCQVWSVDERYDPDMPALLAASAALTLSDIPFAGPVAGTRVCRAGGEFVTAPTQEQLEASDISLVVVSTSDAVVMVDGGAREASEEDVLQAVFLAHDAVRPLIDLQLELRAAIGLEKRAPVETVRDMELVERLKSCRRAEMLEALAVRRRKPRQRALASLRDSFVRDASGPAASPCFSGSPAASGVSGTSSGSGATGTPAVAGVSGPSDAAFASWASDGGGSAAFGEPVTVVSSPASDAAFAFRELAGELVRGMVLGEGRRVDGRGLAQVRPINCKVGVLPRAHGSAIFTRGETQSLGTATLGTAKEEKLLDQVIGETSKPFMLHYNFPPYSTGEVGTPSGPGRREIGHGALAERALRPVLPAPEDYPFTIRVVSEILESNGSSSMAAVCSASLAMMDAGVPLKAPVAGVAMGLVTGPEGPAVLTDITGDEDRLGDMDFKVAGTADGITALQMDMKTAGVTRDVMGTALARAREGRLHVLEHMARVLAAPRADVAAYTPKMGRAEIPPYRIAAVIGPGGKTIRGIQNDTGARLSIDDSGRVTALSVSREAIGAALEAVLSVAGSREGAAPGKEGTAAPGKEGTAAPGKGGTAAFTARAALDIPQDRIGILIGTGGKQIRAVQSETGTRMHVDGDGKVTVQAYSQEAVDAALAAVRAIVGPEQALPAGAEADGGAPGPDAEPDLAARLVVEIPRDRVGAVIGVEGTRVRAVQNRTGARVDVREDGRITVTAPTMAQAEAAAEAVRRSASGSPVHLEIGSVYEGRVVRVERFGTVVEILPGVTGLVHVSQLTRRRVRSPYEVASAGDVMKVMVVEPDKPNQIRLSRTACLDEGVPD
ncbi:MAG: polyribonucleotide nucleotidyltransferase [Deltaproteobacteria bacterium]|jgi:polyribonucleotide nucleotidyltransferase|nr:polyribonucleotide nucleotidyltransferase [Deltaproteobacteria bacterium]